MKEVHRGPQRPREVHSGAQVDVAERFCLLSSKNTVLFLRLPPVGKEVYRGPQRSREVVARDSHCFFLLG